MLNLNKLPELTAAALALSLAACGANDSSNPSVSTPLTVEQGTDISHRPDRTPLVVGGAAVNHKRYPWGAALIDSSEQNAAIGQFCGGSLVAPTWVLTAAHCLENVVAGDTDVLLGQLDLNNNNGERISVSRIIIHPNYKSAGYPDLALMELASPSSAATISLPSRNNPAPNDGEIATVMGWGQVSETGPYSDLLRETSLPIVDHRTCNAAYNGQIDQDSMVCAGTPSGNKDSCYGDSGGPLFVRRASEYVQAGVVSFGEECGLPGVPGVYARVSSYHGWISAYAPVKTYNTSEPVNAPDNNTPGSGKPQPVSNPTWSFQGNLNGWYDEIYFPETTNSIPLVSGKLTINLTTDTQDRLMVFVDEYDANLDEWFTVARKVIRNANMQFEIDIANGEYGFSVLSLGAGGSFTLDVSQ